VGHFGDDSRNQRRLPRCCPTCTGIGAPFHRNTQFVIGMEEGIFPSARARSTMAMEEERRTCYVAMTRARERLVLTWSRLGPDGSVLERSRFLGEIDKKLTRQLHSNPDNELSARRARGIRLDEIEERLAEMGARHTDTFQERKTNAIR
jgi:ATP-dependent exoDNAse (exonuclease V) beta subunit